MNVYKHVLQGGYTEIKL